MDDAQVEARLASLARTGDLDELQNLLDELEELAADDGEPGEVSYKWLCVAADFGHADADELIDAVLDGVLHADDDNVVAGQVHLDLAAAYLTGAAGLPVDPAKAGRHVQQMLELGYPASVQDGEQFLEDARAGMSPDARAAFDASLEGAALSPDGD